MNITFETYDNTFVHIGQVRENGHATVLITDSEAGDGYNAMNLTTGEDAYKLYFTTPQSELRIVDEFPTLLNSAGFKVLLRE